MSSRLGEPHPWTSPTGSKRRARDTVPARVPGNVELDLERAGRLPDPFVGENIHRLRAYESCDWLYTTVVRYPDGGRGQGHPPLSSTASTASPRSG